MGRKQLYGRFKRLINNISRQKTWTWLRKGNFKRETSNLVLADDGGRMVVADVDVKSSLWPQSMPSLGKVRLVFGPLRAGKQSAFFL